MHIGMCYITYRLLLLLLLLTVSITFNINITLIIIYYYYQGGIAKHTLFCARFEYMISEYLSKYEHSGCVAMLPCGN